jgi:GAF domain-containing protein
MSYEIHIELEELPIPEGVIGFSAEYEREDRSVGFPGGWAISGLEITSWRIGALTLTREQMVQAIGEDAVNAIEAAQEDAAVREADERAEADAGDYGDYLLELRRDRIAAE